MNKNFSCCCLIIFFLFANIANAQQDATVKEFNKIFTTYPFSDANPVANPAASIYPYFRYDGFTDKPVQKEWKVVELENDYIRLQVLPQVGGKIWNAYEKQTGKSFLYDNHVIKFRDVAMRGPWTSGGLEPNYGIIGHTPNCATPVDYMTMKKDDGSVSCIIAVLDLLTQTNWCLDINLQKDKAYFTTTSFWYNGTSLEQAYYTWMNTGIKAKGNLEFIYLGTHYLGHEGEYSDWPVNKENGKNISFYEQNNFGGYKSYHVFGKYTDFFGAYWHDDDFGMGRFASHDDKAGKKIWIWGLSQQGMIWEKLLSDTDGQYVEVQSGRLFNQSADGSTFTPFKHYGFTPYTSDEWTEYWFPVKQTKGFVQANNYGALNIKKENGWLKIYFSPLQKINDELKVVSGEKILYSKFIQLQPMQIFADSIQTNVDEKNITVTVGENKLVYSSSPEADVLNRPLETPANFDWNSIYGLYLQGKEDMRQRYYEAAAIKLKACLDKDSNYAPALTEMAALQYRNMQYEDALVHAKKALAIDTYDPQANYYYGLINLQLNNITDAKDGFDIASLGNAYRSAAYTELSKIYFHENNFAKAIEYAQKSFVNNAYNVEAYQLLAVIYRLQKNEAAAKEALQKIAAFNPLNHFSAFENYLWNNTDESKNAFISNIKNEMPEQTFLQLGIWYYNLHLHNEALKVFELARSTAEIIYWKAFLKNIVPQLSMNEAATAFPFRSETAEVLQQLIQKNDDWILKYQLALIYWNRNNISKAKELFVQCGNPSYAPFYATKAMLFTDNTAENLQQAINLDPQQWRYQKSLAEYYIDQQEYDNALSIAKSFYKQHSENYIMGMLYAKCLLLNKKFTETDALLSKLNIIPFEGATDGRQLYHEAKLMQAIDEMHNEKYKKAIQFINDAFLWPENLGVGKPYDDEIDTRLENWLLYKCYAKLNNKTQAQQALQRIIAFTPKRENTVRNYLPANTVISAWALQELNKPDAASQLINEWLSKEPSNKLAQWSLQLLNNKNGVTNNELLKDETVRIIQAWLMIND